MSVLDGIGKRAAGKIAGMNQQHSLIGAAAKLLSSPDVGGLTGLVKLFSTHGHEETVSSWISTGENYPISPGEVEGVLGRERVRQVASTAGVSEQEASQGLSRVLPQLVDQLTPEGKLPPDHAGRDTLSQLASRFLARP